MMEVSTIDIYGKRKLVKRQCCDVSIMSFYKDRAFLNMFVGWLSQDFNIKTLQNLIAERLDIYTSSDDNNICRAVKLSKELMKKQK